MKRSQLDVYTCIVCPSQSYDIASTVAPCHSGLWVDGIACKRDALDSSSSLFCDFSERRWYQMTAQIHRLEMVTAPSLSVQNPYLWDVLLLQLTAASGRGEMNSWLRPERIFRMRVWSCRSEALGGGIECRSLSVWYWAFGSHCQCRRFPETSRDA